MNDFIIEDFIGVFNNVYTKDECYELIKYFDISEKIKRPNNKDKNITNSLFRKDTVFRLTKENIFGYFNYFIPLTKNFWDFCYKNYAEKYNILDNIQEHNIYAWNIQKTEIGEGYHVWHSEHGNRGANNRILAFQIFLNDVDEGGELEFLHQHKRITAQAGKVVIWPAGFTHTHRGNMPLSNSKYVLTGWTEF